MDSGVALGNTWISGADSVVRDMVPSAAPTCRAHRALTCYSISIDQHVTFFRTLSELFRHLSRATLRLPADVVGSAASSLFSGGQGRT